MWGSLLIKHPVYASEQVHKRKKKTLRQNLRYKIRNREKCEVLSVTSLYNQ